MLEDTMMVAGAYADITPEGALPLSGYVSRRGDFVDISDPLEVNVVLVHHAGRVLALVGYDLLYVGAELRSRVEQELAMVLPADRLFLTASHTHFAPATDPLLPRLGACDPAFVERVARRTIDLILRTLARNAVGSVARYTQGRADHSINRRLPHFGLRRDFPFLKTRWELRPNRAAPRDETIHVVAFRDAGGQPVALCWSYACHPVSFPKINSVSADFPGVVRRALRARFGDLPIVYWQGFSGDIRPYDYANGREAAGEPAKFVAFSPRQWNDWAESLAAEVLRAAEAPGRDIAGEFISARRAFALEQLGPHAGGRGLTAHEIRFGNDLSIVGVSAELVVEYTKPLQASRDCAITIPVGCIDGVPGYIPTSPMVRQGGYEVDGFMPLFGVRGRYRADVSTVVEKRLLSPAF